MTQRRLQPVPDSPPRAVLYLRQSVSRDDSVSLELQETAGREHCRRHGYHVVAVESDPGISGRTWKRPAVARVMAMVQAGEADVVVLWKWSRLSRSRRDWAIALDMVEAAGGRVESATEPVDVATSTGRLARGVLAEFAAFESERIGEVWKEVHARRRAKGVPAQGGARFGYRRTDDGGYVPDPETAPILSSMYRRYIAGAGFLAIAAELNQAGHRTLAGGAWSRDRVTRVLDSGFGAGQLVHGKGSRATWVPGVHPAVVDDKTWRAYLAARRRRAGEPPTVTQPVYVLSGLIRCGDCGSPMHATRLGREAGYGYWCSRWAQARTCRCVTVSRAKAERAVLGWLAEEYGSGLEASASRQAARAAAQTVARADARALAREAARLDERLTKLTSGWTDGLVPDDAYRATRDELMADRERVHGALLRVEAEREWRRAPALAAAQTLLEEWDTLPVLSRRELLRTLVRAVRVVRPDGRGPVRVVVDPL